MQTTDKEFQRRLKLLADKMGSMTLIKKILMDKKLKKLRDAAYNYRVECVDWEFDHYTQIIQDCDTWIAGEQNFEWGEVMKLANQYWSDCDNS